MRVLTIYIAAVLAISVGCNDPAAPAPNPTAYTPPVQPVPVPTQPPPTPRPQWLGCPSDQQRVYQEALPIYSSSYPGHDGLLVSLFILCPNGAFSLEFQSNRFGTFDYLGSYAQTDSVVTLSFANFGVSTATLHGATLTVVYNDVMIWSDFMDGPYVLDVLP